MGLSPHQERWPTFFLLLILLVCPITLVFSSQPSPKPSSTPSSSPTASPSYSVGMSGTQDIFDRKRNRQGGSCDNMCSGHGVCEKNVNCKCFTGLDGEIQWTGPDCSLRACPQDFAWVGAVINNNDLHPLAECSNKGLCDRKLGVCDCFPGYEGVACQRTTCVDDCSGRGECYPLRVLAQKAGRTYSKPWDANKHMGCVCDVGYRGPKCDMAECASGPDPLNGWGNEAGRDCSGRGLCDYTTGMCTCFSGFYGTRCQKQTTLY